MIEIDGEPYLTEAQWREKGRAIDGRRRSMGVERGWATGHGGARAVFYPEAATRPFNERELAHRRAERRARDKAAAARREKEKLEEAYHRGYYDGCRREGERCTAYQWVSMGYLPKPDARWREDGWGWYRCGSEDVEPFGTRCALMKRVVAGAPESFDRLPDGSVYDGRPWWHIADAG